MTTENNLSENEENKISTEETPQETSEITVSAEETTPEEEAEAEHSEEHHAEELVNTDVSLADALKEMETIINSPTAGENFRQFNALKEKANHAIHDEIEDKKH